MSGTTTWSELESQPQAWSALIARLEAGDGLPAIDPDAFDEIVLFGSGTSYYLAMAVADWITHRHHTPVVRAVPSCEIMLDTDQSVARHGVRRLAIGFSRSGESSELILAMKTLKLAGCTTLAVGCTAKSTMMELAHQTLLIPEGHEDGLVMLRSFTAMLIALQYLFGTPQDRAALKLLAPAAQDIIDMQGKALRSLATATGFDRFVFLGSGPGYPIAVEASLKIQEMSISTSEAYHSLEYRHGPKATADARTLISLIAISNPEYGLPLAQDLKALGATLLVTGAGASAYAQTADLAIDVPDGLSQAQASVLALLPLQIVAFETALRLGNDPDSPVNLSKVVRF
jgi:glutamine---fructose-6-phosphate transaminase (isomerizing)